MEKEIYDLIIIGAGPAGLGASIYASRYKLSHLVIGTEIGGQVVEAVSIENYAGFKSISGRELMEIFRGQTEELGTKIIQDCVVKITEKDGIFEVRTNTDNVIQSRSLIFALGMKPRKMNIPGEEELIGKGVSYCATCDAMFFRGKDVAVIGGGDSAATEALHLTEFANKVYLLYRDGSLKFEPYWADKIHQNQKIELVASHNISAIHGNEGRRVAAVAYDYAGEKKELPVQGVFIEIGSVPGVAIAKGLGVATDEQDYIIVDQTQATNITHVYAAGDVTTGSNKFRQIITAVSEGAVAAGSVYKALKLHATKK